PTQDGNFIATCQITGKGASGRTRHHALSNLLSSKWATVMDRATESSFEAGSAAAENAREVSRQRPDDGSVSHAGAGESPATVSPSSASPASQAADEKAVPPFNKRGTALLSSEGGDEE
ncbi:hypothetical protein OPR82_22565, partial [Brucella sp. YY2X]|nr:hypothetical protein [Ochrobactrum chromiisoli]